MVQHMLADRNRVIFLASIVILFMKKPVLVFFIKNTRILFNKNNFSIYIVASKDFTTWKVDEESELVLSYYERQLHMIKWKLWVVSDVWFF